MTAFQDIAAARRIGLAGGRAGVPDRLVRFWQTCCTALLGGGSGSGEPDGGEERRLTRLPVPPLLWPPY
jgi:hypothetical protein